MSVPLLRTISVSGNLGNVITKTFANIQYVPVQTNSFEDIEILLRTHTGNPVPFERGNDSDTVLQKAKLLWLKMNNPYIHYYLEQQEGGGMPVFRGSSWLREYGQTGYGLGGVLRSLGKIAKVMITSWAKSPMKNCPR